MRFRPGSSPARRGRAAGLLGLLVAVGSLRATGRQIVEERGRLAVPAAGLLGVPTLRLEVAEFQLGGPELGCRVRAAVATGAEVGVDRVGSLIIPQRAGAVARLPPQERDG